MLLQVDNLKTYLRVGNKTIKAVDGVNFDVDNGETFCLVGESGCGKSILALSIMQLVPAAISSHPGGQILFDYRHDGGTIERVDMLTLGNERKREIRGSRMTMIFQEPMTSLNPVFTVGDQIIEALQLHRPDMSYTDARRRAIESLEQVQIPNPSERIDEYPHRLSGGQRQRVMIAMAMACEPDLLIADEPTTALDVTIQAEILKLMQGLQERKGTSILFITHDFGVVAKMADRLAVMREGRIVETGTLKQILRNPQHGYTKELLAALPENLKRKRDALRGGVERVSPLNGGRVVPGAGDSDIQVNTETPLLDLEGLTIHFPVKKGILRHTVDHIKAVDNIDMQISHGQILALVGESGCGKTTLGRAVLRLIDPTSGTVYFDGQEITHLPRSKMPPFRRQMQIIFQDPMSSLNPRLTIASTLTEPMAVHGIGESKEERLAIAQETLARVQLDASYLWRYPHEFSGGQRQRIGIARALVLNPRFIVCDEVTSALDVSVQAEILQILLDLRRERDLTLLFITHNIGVVEYVSDEMAVMYAGKIVERGATSQVCGEPRHAYTQKLLAAVPHIPL